MSNDRSKEFIRTMNEIIDRDGKLVLEKGKSYYVHARRLSGTTYRDEEGQLQLCTERAKHMEYFIAIGYGDSVAWMTKREDARVFSLVGTAEKVSEERSLLGELYYCADYDPLNFEVMIRECELDPVEVPA